MEKARTGGGRRGSFLQSTLAKEVEVAGSELGSRPHLPRKKSSEKGQRYA